MSLRRLNTIAFYALREVVARLQTNLVKILPAKAAKLIQRQAVTKSNIVIARNFVFRTFRRTTGSIIKNHRFYSRPFAAINFRNRFNYHDHHLQKYNPSLMLLKDDNAKFAKIRAIFGMNPRYNNSLNTVDLPQSLSGFEIGDFIACGCNAAIYELRLREWPTHMPSCSKDKDFPFALKIMFNYQYELPERFLWMEMGPEIVPLPNISHHVLQGKMANFKPLRRQHPNLIQLHTAFVDYMPILPGASALYPEALPTNFEDYEVLLNEPKTLFVVMKRYRMTLRDYVLHYKRNYWSGRVMYGQLLEAIVFLFEHKISHRDIKSDNVLLDFDNKEDVPHLVLSDFGSALASDDWFVPYENDNVDLGGNLSLRAPEIRRAKPARGQLLDFSRSDTWSAATLAYEIFTRANPFYSVLSSESYVEDEIVPLPRRVNYAVKSVTYDMLKINPYERPKPHVAANVVSISLFRFGENLRYFFSDLRSTPLSISKLASSASSTMNALADKFGEKIDGIAELYAAETILSKFISPTIISKAELQLRATFLSRLNRDELHVAMSYILADDAPVDADVNMGHLRQQKKIDDWPVLGEASSATTA